MGAVKLNEHQNFDVGPHPHIGLSTLTYLFEGSIMHPDSLGSVVEIMPGDVNWMTAGEGINHSERTPEYLRHSEKSMHGLQIWVALPKELEQMKPEFFRIGKTEIPSWQNGSLNYKLIAGEAFGRKSPVPVYSKLYMVEIKTTSRETINIGEHLFGETGLYILEGSIETEGNSYAAKQIPVAKEAKLCSLTMEAGTTIYIFGGEPFEEQRLIYWNFVATSKELIENAKQKWIDQQFEKIPLETGFVSLPLQHS